MAMGDETLDSSGQDVPILRAFCQTGEYFREKGDLEKAEAQLREALQLQSNHLAARLMLASILVDNERLDEGLQELEEACRIDEDAARTPMVKALLKKGGNLDEAGQDERALHAYERVLQLVPEDEVAQERISAIWKNRAEKALQADDLDLAISAYEQAGLADEVAKVKTERRRRAIEQAAAEAQKQEQREDWQEACTSYRWLIDEDPQNESWPLALKRAELETKLQDRYAKAADALQRSEWAAAIDLLIEVLTVRPDYKDSASRLAEAVDETRKDEKKSDPAAQHTQDESSQPARHALGDVLKLNPDDAAGLQWEQDPDRRERIRQKKAELYDAAMTMWKGGEIHGALSHLEQLMRLDKEAPETDPEGGVAYADFYQRVRQEHAAIEKALRQGRSRMGDGQFSEALQLCDQYLEKYPGHTLFQALRLDTQDRERQALSSYIAEVDRQITKEPDLDKRVSILEQALNKFPEEPHFSKALRDIRKRLDLVASIVVKAGVNEENGRFEEALEQWETVRSIQPDYPGLEIERERIVRRLGQQVAEETSTPATLRTDSGEKDQGEGSPSTLSTQTEVKSAGEQVANGSVSVLPPETGRADTESGVVEDAPDARSPGAPPGTAEGLTSDAQPLPRRLAEVGRLVVTALAKRPLWFFAGAATLAVALAVFFWTSTPQEKPVVLPVPVSLSTIPAGARLTVDDQTCVTPCQISLASGTYELEARLDGYYPLKRSIYTEAPPAEALALKPMPTLFRIETDLDSGAVKLDDVVAGELVDGVFQTEFDEPGEHTISLLSEKSSATIVVRTAHGKAPRLVGSVEERKLPAVLVVSFGKIGQVYGSGGGKAMVTLNGDPVGELGSEPLELPSLEKGSHALRFSEGKLAGIMLLDVGPEPAATLFVPPSVSAAQEYGTLEVLAREPNGNFIPEGVVVIAGGTYRKPRREDLRKGRRAPYLFPGTYEVHVVGEGYQPSASKEIEISRGMYNLNYALRGAPEEG